jgi:hypothetical protein
MGFYSDLDLILTKSIEKNRKIEEKNFGHFWPPGVPLGVPHISASRSKFENPLGSPSQCHNMTIHAKIQPSSIIQLV